MKRFIFGALFVVLLFGLGTATGYADIVTFQLQNVTFVNPSDLSTPEGTATGTITIDTTLGQWVFGDITYVNGATTVVFDGPPTNTTPTVQDGFAVGAFLSGSDSFAFGVNVASLVGYTGGPLCGYTNEACMPAPGEILVGDIFGPDANAYVNTGSLVQATPEPSTLALLGTGLLGAAGLMRRRIGA